MNVNLDGRESWDPYRHVEHNLLEPRFLYFPSFTVSDDLLLLYFEVGTPLRLILFQTRLEDRLLLEVKSSDTSEIIVESDDFHNIMICDNPFFPLVGFTAGPKACLWDWTPFASCGKYVIIRLQADSKPMVVDAEQILGIERMPELQQRTKQTVRDGRQYGY
ncbi:hypothetical protein FNAPI_14111 [Fusarium napiforme]|uniref:Uncharacterized protein n=1 Tax=Fusarium napiforme TaxID=42672 RepID=A0A8H5MGX4_9HYPO|nr:hypothetical protein FNAPI_14111 [Fusarium napiforme]